MHSGTRTPRVTLVLLASCLWLSGVGLASAAPITYDEAISGDLSGQSLAGRRLADVVALLAACERSDVISSRSSD